MTKLLLLTAASATAVATSFLLPIGMAFAQNACVGNLCPSPVPEPASLTLLVSGVVATIYASRRRKYK